MRINYILLPMGNLCIYALPFVLCIALDTFQRAVINTFSDFIRAVNAYALANLEKTLQKERKIILSMSTDEQSEVNGTRNDV